MSCDVIMLHSCAFDLANEHEVALVEPRFQQKLIFFPGQSTQICIFSLFIPCISFLSFVAKHVYYDYRVSFRIQGHWIGSLIVYLGSETFN